ncbi:hypothetical protein BGX21_000187 [Mortierella sp. AD011]|nr:hypothetical protein BGX20_001292 [Mortierella sp. AD010]KAF9389083.1 hypothetical protein BGX21_000187 [Mortierella sp. AD011]
MASNSAPMLTAKSTIRSLKNFSKGYTDIQAKVRTATSNDPWGPSGSQMNELAEATFNQQAFLEIMEILDKRMNDKGKNWRHVFKALTVLDYLLHVGSENVVKYARENTYVVKTLKEFQYIDEDGKDQGANVRQKVKDIMALLSDETRLREARKSRSAMRDRMSGRARRDNDAYPTYARPGAEDEDRDLQRALRESRRLAHEARGESSDEDLQKALALSKKEEQERLENMEKRNKPSDDWENRSNSSGGRQEQQQDNNGFFGNGQGFGDNFGEDNLVQSQPTGFNNPYLQFQQQQLLQQQQQQLEQQQLQQQMEQQQQLQQQFLQQQQLQQQQLQFQQLQQQQQAFLNTMNNPYQQQLMPQITGAPSIGSNNPFSASNIQKSQANQPFPDSYRINANSFVSNNNGFNNNTSNNSGGSSALTNFFSSSNGGNNSNSNNDSNNNLNNNNSSLGDLAFLQNAMTNTTPASSQPTAKKANPNDEKYANLAMALSNREDGMDTFGNTGQLRVPSHHTQVAPVALASHITGASNPFQRSNIANGSSTNNPFQGISQPGGFNTGGFVSSGGVTNGSFGNNNNSLF